MCAKFFLTVKKRRKVKKVSEIWALYGTKLPLPLINLVPAMKPGGSKSCFARVFHDLACIIDLLTALKASFT
jgi:hypothetical protein